MKVGDKINCWTIININPHHAGVRNTAIKKSTF
nr:MAG TPA: hypothetical protein [Caudoviricetes sp.]